MDVDIIVKRPDKTYKAGETVRGVLRINCSGKGASYNSIVLNVEGSVIFNVNVKNAGILDAIYGPQKPIHLIQLEINIAQAGKLHGGITEIPFEFLLQPTGKHPLYESYKGVYINVLYKIHCTVSRGLFSMKLKATTDFTVHVPGQSFEQELDLQQQPVPFSIQPQTLKNIKKDLIDLVPDFKVSGVLDSSICDITKPFTGNITIESSERPIRSIEMQLVRMESFDVVHNAKEGTEIQNLQLGDGDVCRGLKIPIYMVFPRSFCCPTLITDVFRIEFEVNLIISFRDGHQITENFPITLFRRP
jgi:hypothetical protein